LIRAFSTIFKNKLDHPYFTYISAPFLQDIDSRIQREFYSTCILFKDIDDADKAFDEVRAPWAITSTGAGGSEGR
jgi:hypothetical protein